MISIRPATIDDVTILQKLNQEIFIDNQKYDNDLDMNWAVSEKGRTYFKSVLNDKNAICFIAVNSTKPIGYIACNIKDYSYRKSKYLEIQNMGVIPQFQSQGIGALLINQVKVWAKQHEFEKMLVNSYFKNTKAIDFYKKNGFSEIDISLEIKLDY